MRNTFSSFNWPCIKKKTFYSNFSRTGISIREQKLWSKNGNVSDGNPCKKKKKKKKKGRKSTILIVKMSRHVFFNAPIRLNLTTNTPTPDRPTRFVIFAPNNRLSIQPVYAILHTLIHTLCLSRRYPF